MKLNKKKISIKKRVILIETFAKLIKNFFS